jgi:hypothetical protein
MHGQPRVVGKTAEATTTAGAAHGMAQPQTISWPKVLLRLRQLYHSVVAAGVGQGMELVGDSWGRLRVA